MCVIIVKEDKNQKVETSTLIASSILNPDGLGVLWLDSWQIEYFESEDWKVLDTNRPFVGHFRYATVGKVCIENCHPFNIDKSNVLFQNGTVHGMGDKSKTDTQALAELLSEMDKSLWPRILSMTECRYVIADIKARKFELYNKDLWTQKDGVWYSKTNVLNSYVVSAYGTLKRGHGNHDRLLRSANFIGRGLTVKRFPMIDHGVPFVSSRENSMASQIVVDTFLVDKFTLKGLDDLEGHPNWYKREMTKVEIDGQIIESWLYFNDTEDYSDVSTWISEYRPEVVPKSALDFNYKYSDSYDYKDFDVEESDMAYELCVLFGCDESDLIDTLLNEGYSSVQNAYEDYFLNDEYPFVNNY